MAKPTTPIIVWAKDNVTLPVAGGPNKVKPIADLLSKGYDKTQKPAAEEFNYILNMSSGWLSWIVDEKFPELEQEIQNEFEQLEARLNTRLLTLEGKVTQLEQDLPELRNYVDQKVTNLELNITANKNSITQLRNDFNAAMVTVNDRLDDIEPRLVPIGGIMPWPGQIPPQGWLECNGQVYNTSQNPGMFSVLGKNTVPDYRGLFLRGWAHGSSAYDPDSGRALGSIQVDTIKNITGTFIADIAAIEIAGREVSGAFRDEGGFARGDSGTENQQEVRKYSFDASREVPTSPEVRPKNISVMYIIKTDLAESSGSSSPTGIVVNPTSISGQVGNTTSATAAVIPTNLAPQYPVTWSSRNTSVATVNSAGVVTLVGPGTTEIVASISTGMTGVISLTSYSVLTNLSIAAVSNIETGNSVQLSLNKTPSNASEPLSYSSGNTGVASVNEFGYVTGISPGTTAITVVGTISGVSAAVTVNIVAATVSEVVQDTRLGAVVSYVPASGADWTFQAPAGCTLTGMVVEDAGTDSESLRGIYYKPIQKKVQGTWVTIVG